MAKNYPPGFTYQEFAPKFKAEFFEPDNWAELFAKAGAKLVSISTINIIIISLLRNEF